MAKINYSGILKSSWEKLLKQFWLLVGLGIGFTIVYSLLCIFSMPKQGEALKISGIVTGLLSYILLFIFTMGYMKNCFQTIDDEEPQFSAYGQVSTKIITFLAASVIYSIIVTIGLILFILPGIYLTIRLHYYMAAIVDEDAGIINSLKRSWQITKGQVLPVFIILLIITALSFIGILALIAGIFIAIPLTALIDCTTFRRLTAPSSE
ncbi:MAG: hypothetical protein LBD80_03165 [Tannerella sp.]|jgi:uncharacterized membrane protein|nr:hypothetical protein [Tannerella sp.]